MIHIHSHSQDFDIKIIVSSISARRYQRSIKPPFHLHLARPWFSPRTNPVSPCAPPRRILRDQPRNRRKRRIGGGEFPGLKRLCPSTAIFEMSSAMVGKGGLQSPIIIKTSFRVESARVPVMTSCIDRETYRTAMSQIGELWKRECNSRFKIPSESLFGGV